MAQSMVRGTQCSSRRPKFSSKYPHVSPHSSVIPLSAAAYRCGAYIYIYRQTSHTHNIKINLVVFSILIHLISKPIKDVCFISQNEDLRLCFFVFIIFLTVYYNEYGRIYLHIQNSICVYPVSVRTYHYIYTTSQLHIFIHTFIIQ